MVAGLIGFIPYIGGLIPLIFNILPGTSGTNRYGPDPKDRDGGVDIDLVFS